MPRTLQTSKDVGGESNSLQKPGTYHCQVTHSADGESTRGKPNSCVAAILSVLAGTESDQVKKEFHLHLWDPDLTKPAEKQEWATKKQTAYAIAINQLDPSKMGEEVEIEFGEAEGQQILITVGFGQKKITNDKNEIEWVEDETKVDLSYANIYHVDDPRAADFPKDMDALALLPEGMRRKPEFFAALQRKVSTPAVEPKAKLNDEQLAGL